MQTNKSYKKTKKTMKNSNICRVVALAVTAAGSLVAHAQDGSGGESWRPPYITSDPTTSAFTPFRLTNNFLTIEGVISPDYAKAWLQRWQTEQYQIHLAPKTYEGTPGDANAGCLATRDGGENNSIKMDMYDPATGQMITGGVTEAALDGTEDLSSLIYVNELTNDQVFDTHYMAADNLASATRPQADLNTTVQWGINGYLDNGSLVQAPDFTAGYTGNAGFGVNSESTWTFETIPVTGSFETGGSSPDLCVDVPVTLSYAYMSRSGDTAKFSWATEDETNNLGFHLWAKVDGSWQLLNPTILLTNSPDSFETNRYSWNTSVEGEIEAFGLSQVDVDGTESFYGPYKPGVRYGSKDGHKKIDWDAIRTELDAKMIESGMEPVAGGYVRKTLLSSGDVVLNAVADAAENDPVIDSPESLIRRELPVDPDGPQITQKAVGIGLIANVRVSETGIVRVGLNELAAMGIELDVVASDTIAVINRGSPVSRHIGTDASGDRYIEFYAEEVDGIALQSTRENVYQISVEPDYVRKAVQLEATSEASGSFIANSKVEQENGWSFSFGAENDQWYMGIATERQTVNGDTGEVVVNNSPFKLTNLNATNIAEGFAVLSVEGVNAWDHASGADGRYIISVNGTKVGHGNIDGRNSRVLRAVVNTGILNEGDNEVEVQVSVANGVLSTRFYVDSVSLQYPTNSVAEGDLFVGSGKGANDGYSISGISTEAEVSAYAFSSSSGDLYKLATSRDENGNVQVASSGNNPRDMANYWVGSVENLVEGEIEMIKPDTSTDIADANYIIIAHESFSDTIENEYVSWKEQQTYFDEDGNEQNYKIALVELKDIYDYYGGGLVDASGIRNFLTTAGASADHVMLVGGASLDFGRSGSNIYNFIPTYYQRASEEQLSPNDGWLVGSDLADGPGTAIGRLPVRNAADLSALLTKTKNYADRTDTGMVVAYDDLDDPLYRYYADLATADALRDENYSVKLGSVDLGNYAVQTGIRDAFNDGVSTMVVQTHGSPYVWGGGSLNNYTFLNYNKSKAFNATDQGTLVYAMTCYTTFFPSTRNESISNILINNRFGAVAMAGSSVISRVDNNVKLTNRMLNLTQQERKTIGQALQTARYEKQNNAAFADSLISWNLLGDPTVRATVDNLR